MKDDIHLIRRSEEQRRRDWIIGTAYNDAKARCRVCGKKIIMPLYKERCKCNWCGYTVINNSKAHFKYKMREIMNK